MKVSHKIDDFLVELFPQYKKSNHDLEVLEERTNYFSVGPYKPKVTIEDEWVSIEVDTDAIADQSSDYRKVVSLSEKEIAMLGTNGISPGRDDYKLDAFPDKVFSGYQMLAWYYVSFKLALPEIVDELGLGYEKEYELAAQSSMG